MRSVAVAKNSAIKPRTKRFGFGYEKKSTNRPSTLIARAEFLSHILDVKPNVVSSLFYATYHHFASLTAENEGVIASLRDSLDRKYPMRLIIFVSPQILSAKPSKNSFRIGTRYNCAMMRTRYGWH